MASLFRSQLKTIKRMENREENSICNKTRKAQKNYELWLIAATSNEICTKLRRYLHLMTFHIMQSPYNQQGLKDSNNDSACNKHVWREWRVWECYHCPFMPWESTVKRQDEESGSKAALAGADCSIEGGLWMAVNFC